MKYNMFLCILIFITVFSSFISAATIADVPTNHWAFEDVKFTVDKGLFELYEDGSFRGSDNVSRYQIAVIVARLLEEIKGGNISASEEDMELLRKLSLEFQEELVDLALKGDVFTEQIKALEQKNLIQDEFLTEIKDIDIASLNKEMAELNERIANAESDVTSIIDSILKLKQVEEKLLLLEKASNEQATIIKENQKQIEDLKEINLQFTDETIQSLSDRITINATRLNSLQDELTTVRSELEAKNIEIEKLEVENKNYKNYLYGVGAVSLILLLLSN